ncbi:MAG: LacI family transcriptional regulator [Bacillales bacterium]|jgi:LacI family transcriptional regulator|nr:LacI family transcriptional regulator [Bacillales bacterium]
MKHTTLKDVAKQCGVSMTTASLVLNNCKNSIPQITKDKIKETAKVLNYQPNRIALSLATQKSKSVGIIVPDISNGFFADSIKNIQIELNNNGYEVFVCNTDEKHKNDIRYIELLVSRKVDGIIITISAESMVNDNWKQIKELLDYNSLPYVLYDRFYPGNPPKVYVNNQLAAYEVAKLLIAKGHKEIGVITGPLSLNSSAGRLQGVKEAFQEINVSIKEENIFKGQYNYFSGKEGGLILLKNKVSAVFCFNDLQAYGVMEIAQKQNLSIPKDFSLVGFDDIFYSSILNTQLTTVRQPITEMAKQAVKLLLDLINNISTNTDISLPGEIIIRDSLSEVNNER